MADDSLFRRSYGRRISEIGRYAPSVSRAFHAFNQQALAPGALSGKLKELIAVAVAHVTGCPYCIEAHISNVKKLEATKEEIFEAIMVATALKAGSALAHGVNALQAYDEADNDELYLRSNAHRIAEFRDSSPDLFNSFARFDSEALKTGLLSKKEKELMAVAVAHVTGCPYCIDGHTKSAKRAGATLEELAEAIFVATALKAGSALAHSVNALNAYDE